MPFDSAMTIPRATAAPAIAPTLIKMVRARFCFAGASAAPPASMLRSPWWSRSLPQRCLPASGFRLSAIAEATAPHRFDLRRFERLAVVRRRDCLAMAPRQTGQQPALASSRLPLPGATDRGSFLAAQGAPTRYWRSGPPAPASRPPGERPYGGCRHAGESPATTPARQ